MVDLVINMADIGVVYHRLTITNVNDLRIILRQAITAMRWSLFQKIYESGNIKGSLPKSEALVSLTDMIYPMPAQVMQEFEEKAKVSSFNVLVLYMEE